MHALHRHTNLPAGCLECISSSAPSDSLKFFPHSLTTVVAAAAATLLATVGSQVGHQLVAAYATCTGLPLYRRRIQGHSRSQDLSYSTTAGDEVEDLFLLLAYVKVCAVAVTMCSAARACRTQQHLQHSTGGCAAAEGWCCQGCTCITVPDSTKRHTAL